MATVSDHKTLDCPLCFNKFSIPRMLPCSHTFCEKCLGTHIESQVQGGTKFLCPLCAALTTPSDSKAAVDIWASSFPLNAVVSSMLESAEITQKVGNNCEPCETDGETTNAEVWCTNCREMLCGSCERLHKRNKQMKNHKTVSIAEMDQNSQSNIIFDLECGRHRDKKKELFCLDHRELYCVVCVATDHRQCNDIRTVDDISRDQSQRSTSDYSRVIQDFRNLKTEMEKVVTEKIKNATQVMREKEQILHDIDNKIDRIIVHLNKLRKSLRNETNQLYKETESLLQKNENMVKRFITNIENSNEILEAADNNGTLQQKFVIFEDLHTQISSHYLELKSKLKDDVNVHLTVNISKDLTDMEEKLNVVGSVNVSSESSVTSRDVLQSVDRIMKDLNTHTKISTDMCAAQVQKDADLMTSPVTFVKAMTRDDLGRGTWFTGGTFLSNGRLMMCDLNNNRLVELDDEYNVVKEYKMDGKPTDAAAGNTDNEIYIAVNEEYIYKCRVHTDLTVVSKIKAPSGTWGLAVSGDNIIVSTSDAVVILTQDGSTLRSIPKSGYLSYVAVSQTQRKIYHRDNHDVVCRTWEGQEMFRYQHDQLKEPRGICTDKYNNVYICGGNSHNVHHVSRDGHRSKIVQLQNIPLSSIVMLHPKNNQLIVTSWNQYTVCEIYKLC